MVHIVKPLSIFSFLLPPTKPCLGFRPLLELWILFVGCVLCLAGGWSYMMCLLQWGSHFFVFVFFVFYIYLFWWKRGNSSFITFLRKLASVWYVSLCMYATLLAPKLPIILPNYQEETSKLFVTILPKKKLFVILIPNLYSNKSNSINKIN